MQIEVRRTKKQRKAIDCNVLCSRHRARFNFGTITRVGVSFSSFPPPAFCSGVLPMVLPLVLFALDIQPSKARNQITSVEKDDKNGKLAGYIRIRSKMHHVCSAWTSREKQRVNGTTPRDLIIE